VARKGVIKMILNGSLAYEKLGNEIYLSLNNEIYILDNEVSIYIFELLRKQTEINKIKETVINYYSDTSTYSNEEKKLFVEEFIHELIHQNILLDEKLQYNA
jgi:hypothetical protein